MEDREGRIGWWVSGTAHGALILWAILGGVFLRPQPGAPVRTTEVATISGADFEALAAEARGAGPVSREATAVAALPAPAIETDAAPAPAAASLPDAEDAAQELAPPEVAETRPDLTDFARRDPVAVATDLAALPENQTSDDSAPARPADTVRPVAEAQPARPLAPAADEAAPPVAPRSELALERSALPRPRPEGLVERRDARLARQEAERRAAADAAREAREAEAAAAEERRLTAEREAADEVRRAEAERQAERQAEADRAAQAEAERQAADERRAANARRQAAERAAQEQREAESRAARERREAEERQAEEREAERRAEAEQRTEEERRAQAEREAAERREAEARQAEEREAERRAEAERQAEDGRRAQAEREAAERREAEARQAEERRAEAERQAAEERRAQAERAAEERRVAAENEAARRQALEDALREAQETVAGGPDDAATGPAPGSDSQSIEGAAGTSVAQDPLAAALSGAMSSQPAQDLPPAGTAPEPLQLAPSEIRPTPLDDSIEMSSLSQAAPLSMAEKDAFRTALRQCWNEGALSVEAQQMSVSVGFSMTADGRPIESSLRIAEFRGGSEAGASHAFDVARRAIMMCGGAGFPLPFDKFSRWRDVVVEFRPDGIGFD